ncbi:thiolase C-terminal domain-containing protein [Pseudonocardia xishanensis]|uniref:OB-fold domain-containing protein n=1 Tax=Pseudonocardia xishanensis TaxID=630995 RepID=A0ABP8RV77_9PSEU
MNEQGWVREPPRVTPENEFFWRGGEVGELRLQRCTTCQTLRHPPGPVCPRCGSDGTEIAAVSGRAVVEACTVNHRRWHPDVPVPYAVAIVSLVEDREVRLVTNIVGCPPEEVRVGQSVRVDFERIDGDVWVPVFRPDGASDVDLGPPPPVPTAAGLLLRRPRFEDRVSISGVGQSEVGRRLMRPPLSLTVDACRAALDDAGLTWADVDGLSTYPGPGDTGMGEGGIVPLVEALRLQPTWFNSGFELPGQLGSVVAAMLAVASGLCRHVLCYRTVWQSTEATLAREGRFAPGAATPIWGHEWRAPYAASKAVNLLAARATRYMHTYGATREMLGWVAVTERRHAGANPDAIYRTPLTMEQYLAAEPISTPFGIYDCDLLCDGAVAVVVSARDAEADLASPPVRVEAVGTRIVERTAWDQGVLTHEPQIFGPAEHMWSRTDLRPADVDVAELYDGFTFNAVSWLEALGFCGIGEAKDLVDGGKEIGLDGRIPLNTHGGQLSAGRLHGYGFLLEAVAQLRGRAGERQVSNARTAVVTSGGLTPGGAMLLRAP